MPTKNKTDQPPVEHQYPRTAAQAEAVGEDKIAVAFRGHDYLVPRDPNAWSIDTLEAIENNRLTGIVKGILGDIEYAAFKRRSGTVADLTELAEKLMDALGLAGVGE